MKISQQEWEALPLEQKYTEEELKQILKDAEEDYPIIRERKWISKEEALMIWPNKTILQ